MPEDLRQQVEELEPSLEDNLPHLEDDQQVIFQEIHKNMHAFAYQTFWPGNLNKFLAFGLIIAPFAVF